MSIFGAATAKMEGMYRYFLDDIRRYGVGVVPPDRFNRLINEAMIDWMKDKAKEIGVGQKRIDDLRAILIELNQLDLYQTGGSPTIISNVFVLPNGVYDFDDSGVVNRYWRADALRVKIEDGTDWIPMDYLSANRKTEVQRDPYAQASLDRGHYWIVGNNVKMDIGSGNVVYLAEFEYYCYPTALAYIDGTDVDPVFEDEQLLEIVNKAARTHLERIQSPRHPSYATEDQIKPK